MKFLRKDWRHWLALAVTLFCFWMLPTIQAQETSPATENAAPAAENALPATDAAAPEPGDKAAERFQEVMDADAAPAEAEPAPLPTTAARPEINVLDLFIKGGIWSVPIVIISLMVVAFGIERAMALRRSKVMPTELITALSEMAQQGSFDPRKAYRLCQQYPSAASAVIRSMLLKVGRPHSEVEHAVAEASNREAERLYANVRFMNLATAIAPLLGLLGTVVGMVQSFFVIANLAPGMNKGAELADGIYVALVTTVEGLCVAIPSAIMAHYFEGRIQTLLREVDELLFNLLPQVEKYENKLRVRREQLSGEGRNGSEKSEERSAEPAETSPAAARAAAAAK
jgi:biopolymer transport protein ExbB